MKERTRFITKWALWAAVFGCVGAGLRAVGDRVDAVFAADKHQGSKPVVEQVQDAGDQEADDVMKDLVDKQGRLVGNPNGGLVLVWKDAAGARRVESELKRRYPKIGNLIGLERCILEDHTPVMVWSSDQQIAFITVPFGPSKACYGYVLADRLLPLDTPTRDAR